MLVLETSSLKLELNEGDHDWMAQKRMLDSEGSRCRDSDIDDAVHPEEGLWEIRESSKTRYRYDFGERGPTRDVSLLLRRFV